MPRLQRYLTKDRDVSGDKAAYYNYRITVPAGIVNAMNIAGGQTLYARLAGRRILLQKGPAGRPVRARCRQTRFYNGMPCFVTEIILPIEFIRELKLQKGQELDFETHDEIITISG